MRGTRGQTGCRWDSGFQRGRAAALSTLKGQRDLLLGRGFEDRSHPATLFHGLLLLFWRGCRFVSIQQV